MRSYRVLSFAVLLCIICSIICGRTYASGIWTIDGNVDPWGDLEEMENWKNEQEEQQAASDSDLVAADEEFQSDFGFIGDNSLFSLNDDNISRTIILGGGSVSFGGFMNRGAAIGPMTESISSASLTLDYTNNTFVNLSSFFNRQNTYGSYISVNQGVFIDVTASVDYSSNAYESFTISGGGSAFLNGGTTMSATNAYPDAFQLIVNGNPTGEIYDMDNLSGSFTIPNITYDITSNVSSIGYRFLYNSPVTKSTIGNSASNTWYLRFRLNDTSVFTVTEVAAEPEYTGLLGTIIGWLTNVWEGITNLPTLILDGIKSLFVPSDEQLQALSDQYDGLFEEKLGFVYQLLSWVVDSFTSFKDTLLAGTTYSFTFPGIRFPYDGEMIEILPEQEVSLENGFMEVVRPVLGTIVSIVAVVGFANVCFDMVVAFISGASYFEFRKGKKGSEEE